MKSQPNKERCNKIGIGSKIYPNKIEKDVIRLV